MKIKNFLFLILFPLIVFAEGGSPYSRIGLGDLYYSYSARRASFGGLGAAVFDRILLPGLELIWQGLKPELTLNRFLPRSKVQIRFIQMHFSPDLF